MATSLGTFALKFVADTSGLARGVGQVQSVLSQGLSGLGQGLGLGILTGGTAGVVAALTTQFLQLAQQGVRSVVHELGEAAERVDRLAKVSGRLGVPLNDMLTLGHAANLAGANFESVTRGMQKMLITVGTGGKTVAQRFQEVAAAISKIPDVGQRAQQAVKTFGKEGAELLNVLKELADNLDRANRLTERFGLGLSPEEAAGVEAMNDAWTDLTFVLDGFWNKFAATVAPALKTLLETLLTAAEELGASFQALGVNWEVIGDVATAVGALMATTIKLSVGLVRQLSGGWMAVLAHMKAVHALTTLNSKEMREASLELVKAGIESARGVIAMQEALSGKTAMDFIAATAKFAAELKNRQTPLSAGLGGEIGGPSKLPGALEFGTAEAARAIRDAGGNPLDAVRENTRQMLLVLKPMREDIGTLARGGGKPAVELKPSGGF